MPHGLEITLMLVPSQFGDAILKKIALLNDTLKDHNSFEDLTIMCTVFNCTHYPGVRRQKTADSGAVKKLFKIRISSQ